ncbi:MAG: lysophospholipid acyltransferase family protein [Alphaproteobacteria bacterium]
MKKIKIALYFLTMIIYSLLFFATMWWVLILPKRYARIICNVVPFSYLNIVDVLFGFERRVIGVENKPDYPVIYAVKHQSTYETFWSAWELKNSFYVIKKQLLYIPIIGLYFWRAGMIAIDRSKGRDAIKKMLKDAKVRIDNGGILTIFPEGTRTAIGEKREYKQGVYIMATELNMPVVPVAVNTGLYWKKGMWNGKSGRVTMEYLPEISAVGKTKEQFLKELQTAMEKASDNLAKNP